MPRRPPPDLTIVPLVPGKGRPEAPKTLDPVEARAWNDTIDALPGQWVDPAGQLLLRRVAAQAAIAERLETRLRRLGEMADTAETLEAEKVMATMHRDALKAMVVGLDALRATPKARMAARESRSRFEGAAMRSRPWDITARKLDPDDDKAS
jgi:hypothetical protein